MPFHWRFRACSPQAVVDSGVDVKHDAIDEVDLGRDAEQQQLPSASGFHDLPQDLLEHVFRHLEGGTRKNHFAV